MRESSTDDIYGDDSDSDDEPESTWDLQGGHSTRTAEMVYGRQVQQGAVGTPSQRAQFRKINVRWHQFFHLVLGEEGIATKRRLDKINTMSHPGRAVKAISRRGRVWAAPAAAQNPNGKLPGQAGNSNPSDPAE